jgi:putative colanic acid biosynthesis UDP-glucose lipid carrier transferase
VESKNLGFVRQHHLLVAFSYRACDSLIIIAFLYGACWIYDAAWTTSHIIITLAAIVLFSLFGESMQLYRSWRGVPYKQSLMPVLVTWILSMLALLIADYVINSIDIYAQAPIRAWIFLTPLVLIAWRILIRVTMGFFRLRGFNYRNVAIAGITEQGDRLAQAIQSTPSLGLRLLGFFDERAVSEGRTKETDTAPIVGDVEKLITLVKHGEVDLVYIAISMKGEDRIYSLIERLSDTTASVYVVPDLFTHYLMNSRMVNLGPIPTISIFETPFHGINGWLKRIEDITLSSLILAMICIPMLVIAIGIKWTSPGPVIFNQRRYGLGGKSINVLKFRTMTVAEDENEVIQARKNDNRVTPFGAFLRGTSLDELPQFINVLMGDMSIVGPRPHAAAHNEEYRKLISGYMLRHKVKPGITGWAQINGFRGETDTIEKMEERIKCDLWYIRKWTVGLDLMIIARTIGNGFTGPNAY